MPHRGRRPWDPTSPDMRALLYVAANPDMERYKIAEALGMSLSKLSTITCSPEGVAMLEYLARNPRPELFARFKLLDRRTHWRDR